MLRAPILVFDSTDTLRDPPFPHTRPIDFCIPRAETFTGIRARRRWCGVESVKMRGKSSYTRCPSPWPPRARSRASSACGCAANSGGGRTSRSSCARRYSIIGPHLRRAQSAIVTYSLSTISLVPSVVGSVPSRRRDTRAR